MMRRLLWWWRDFRADWEVDYRFRVIRALDRCLWVLGLIRLSSYRELHEVYDAQVVWADRQIRQLTDRLAEVQLQLDARTLERGAVPKAEYDQMMEHMLANLKSYERALTYQNAMRARMNAPYRKILEGKLE